jgi:prepilin-type N-terminal cleavage/methylation domain-containing protein
MKRASTRPFSIAGRAIFARQVGFSLIELLVTIALISLLVGLLLPSLSKAHRSARQLQCLSNLHQIAVANQIYQQEFAEWELPAHWGWSPPATGWNPGTPPPLPANETYHTWADTPTIWEVLASVKHNSRFTSKILCPDAPLAQADGNTVIGFGIGMSYNMNFTSTPGYPIALAPDYFNGWKRSQIRAPAEKIQFVDAIGAVSIGGAPNPTMRYFLPTWGEVHYPPDHTSIVAYRHHNGACALYFDGHAAWSPVTQLLYNPADPTTASRKRQWEPTAP